MIFRAIISIILTSLLTIIVIIVYGYKQDQEKSIKKEIKQQNSP